MRHRRDEQSGFTLIEVLVVVAIIALLAAILLPSLTNARAHAKRIKCVAQLRQIGDGVMTYVNVSGDLLPDTGILGAHVLRQAPGTKAFNDPFAKPEVYGMEAALEHRAIRALPKSSDLWICPTAQDWMVRGKNSYVFLTTHPGYDYGPGSFPTAKHPYSTLFSKWRNANSLTQSGVGFKNRKITLVWDNYAYKYGLTGYYGPFTAYNIPVNQYVMPHPFFSNGWLKSTNSDGSTATAYAKTTNALFLDLHVGTQR